MKVTSNTQKPVNSNVQKMIIDKLKGFEFTLLHSSGDNGNLYAYIKVGKRAFKIYFLSGKYSVNMDGAGTEISLKSRMKTMTTINKAIIKFS